MTPEPYKTKVCQRIRLPSPEEREAALRAAGYNTFLIPSDLTYIDLVSDSGTSAMSDTQWAAMLTADEAFCGQRSYQDVCETARNVFGYDHVVLVHQGRAAEHLLFELLVKEGGLVPSNGLFDTTRTNIEARGAVPLDVPCSAAERWDQSSPFRGNIDLDRISDLVAGPERSKIPLVLVSVTTNRSGGQPISLANLRTLAEILRPAGIPLFFDACRFAENAYLIQQRESDRGDHSIQEIVREMFSLGSGCFFSAKKDGLSNTGGLIAVRDGELAQRLEELVILWEGFPSHGGIASRDLKAISVGLYDVLDEVYLRYRVEQVERLGRAIASAGIPVVDPIGGHAVCIRAEECLLHLGPEKYPAFALAAEVYRSGGVRGAATGGLLSGATPSPPALFKLSVPRRVYSDSHLEYAAHTVERVVARSSSVKGLVLKSEPRSLKHFTSRFDRT